MKDHDEKRKQREEYLDNIGAGFSDDPRELQKMREELVKQGEELTKNRGNSDEVQDKIVAINRKLLKIRDSKYNESE